MRLLAILCALLAATAVFSGPLERKLIYVTDPTYTPPPARYVEHRMDTGDDETIIVWARKPNPGRTTIVYFHGNAGTLTHRLPRFDLWANEGLGIIAMAYRGYSGSTGTPTQKSIVADAQKVLNSVETFGATSQGGITLYGESLGAAVVAQISDTDVPYRAIILEAPFTSVPDLAEYLLPKLSFATVLLRDKWNSLGAIAHAKNRPVLVLHGENDTFIPMSMGQAMADGAATDNARLYAVKGAGHTDVWQPDAQRVMMQFIRTH